MTRSTFLVLPAVLTGILLSAGSAAADGTPQGVWIDHTGRGAVEIKDCDGGLCGRVVWVKDPKHLNTCRNQIIGNVKSVSTGVWDRGWIVDPDDNRRYSVELKLVGNDRLRVTGYLGSKLFSETMMWKRAPADLKRCDGVQTAAAPPTPAPGAARPAPGPAVTSDPEISPQEQNPQRPASEAVPPQRSEERAPEVRTDPPAQTTEATPPAGQRSDVGPPEDPPKREDSPRVATGPKIDGLDLGDLIRIKPIRGGRDGKRMCRVELPYFSVEVPCDL